MPTENKTCKAASEGTTKKLNMQVFEHFFTNRIKFYLFYANKQRLCSHKTIYIRLKIESHPARQKNARSCSISLSFSEGTRLRGVPKKCVCRCPRRYTCFLCLSLLKGCLPLRGEGSLWQATGSNRALVAKKFTYWQVDRAGTHSVLNATAIQKGFRSSRSIGGPS